MPRNGVQTKSMVKATGSGTVDDADSQETANNQNSASENAGENNTMRRYYESDGEISLLMDARMLSEPFPNHKRTSLYRSVS